MGLGRPVSGISAVIGVVGWGFTFDRGGGMGDYSAGTFLLPLLLLRWASTWSEPWL